MISAILLAAGKSKRMNGENKLTKKINGIPLINKSIKSILESSINELVIVTGYQKAIIENIIKKNEKIKFAFNEDFESGIASSIKKGLMSLNEKTKFFFVSLGDMPLVNSKDYDQLISLKDKKEIIVPYYKGTQGNPILFSISMKEKIMNIKGDVGAKQILEFNKEKIFHMSTNNSGVVSNFNTKENFN